MFVCFLNEGTRLWLRALLAYTPVTATPPQACVGQRPLCQELREGRQRKGACGALSLRPALELHWKFLDLCSPASS